ncbi:hypothetical protein [Agromyces salentinus]|uniref:Alpha/beta hydrolase n=1 Tax=Agromyces salentinus TaxID=269421 RepID=A0ABN2MMP7_9MICO|nr:hypothetical protein [Agromyces salentinus]
MRISELTEAGAVEEHPDGSYDVALVLVHGMGAAYRSQILLEWAEPLLARMDWMARDRIYGEGDHGVELDQSNLAGDEPVITATVRFPKRRPPGTPENAPTITVERKIAIVEARWSEAFVPLGRAQIFRWAAPFMWRAFLRMLRLFWSTMFLVPWYTLVEHTRTERKYLVFPHPITFVLDLVRAVLGFALYVPIAVFILLLATVLTPILPLISPLLLIPWFKDLAAGVIDSLAESIGDVTAWKETPVRASAMRLIVRDAVSRAKSLVGDGDVHVFAHSQGAAVSTFALFEEMEPSDFNVRHLTTVGAAVTLLGRDQWRGRTDPYTPVQNWLARRTFDPDHPVSWSNHWAIWDPFSAGPIADDSRKARQRWRASYFPRLATDACGPEEHAVHNTSQPFLDHSMYFQNTLQVVEPTIRNLLGPDFPAPPPEVAYLENRLNVINKKSLGVNMVAAVVIAALLPGIAAASAFFASVITTVAGWFSWVVGLFNGGAAAPDAAASVGFLHEQGQLTGWGWLIVSGLLAALLVWLNQTLAGYTERTLIWDRCPLPVGAWLVVSSIPRFLYVAAAAVVVWAFLLQQLSPDAAGAVWTGVIVLAAAIFLFLEPRFAPVPVVVDARTDAADVQAVRANAATPMTLHATRGSDAYKKHLKDRQKTLDPRGPWAKSWAYLFHGWGRKAAPVVGGAPRQA